MVYVFIMKNKNGIIIFSPKKVTCFCLKCTPLKCDHTVPKAVYNHYLNTQPAFVFTHKLHAK